MKCRSCGSDNVHRSRLRSARESLATRVTPGRYYRCHDCNDRFFAFGGRTPKPPVKPKANVVSGAHPSRRSARRRARTIRIVRIVIIAIIVLAAIYFLVLPYAELGRPVPRHK